MPQRGEPTPEELEESRDVRISMQQLSKLEIMVNHLEHAAACREDVNQPDPDLLTMIKRSRGECAALRAKCLGRVESRRRPHKAPDTTSCTVFLDECGAHEIDSTDEFPVFCLAAVIIRDDAFHTVDGRWKQWKIDNLGYDALVHEPDIRRHRRPFTGQQGDAAVAALPEVLGELDFTGLVVVLHRPNYQADFGGGPIDASLPRAGYMVALDFLMERTVFALDGQFNGARARVVAESRGAKEDALLQYEYSRLQLDGTSYINDAWFRQQLEPGITFKDKLANDTGLQMADLLARPVAERFAWPDQEPPDRWDVMSTKLCRGQETKHSAIGLKIMPWREAYEALLES